MNQYHMLPRRKQDVLTATVHANKLVVREVTQKETMSHGRCRRQGS